VVDLAGGEGRNALWFAGRGWETENVEFSKVALEKYLERAKNLNVSGLSHATHSDAKTAQFQLEPSLLLICYLQLPWDELRQALDNALSQLKAGVIFGVWHSLSNVTEGYGGPPTPELNVDPESLRVWAKANDLDASVEERRREVLTPEGPRQAIDVQLRASV